MAEQELASCPPSAYRTLLLYLGKCLQYEIRLLSFVLPYDGSQANRLSICFLKMEPCPCPASNLFSYKTMSDAGSGFGGIKWGQQREGLSLLPYLAGGQQLIYHLTSHPFYTPAPELHIWADASIRDSQQDAMTDESDIRLFKGWRRY